MDKVEFLILKCLLNDEEYARKVLPFIKEEYFEEFNQKVVFEEIKKFITEYNSNPTRETLIIDVDDRSDLNQQQYSQICNLIQNLDSISVENDWLIDTTEKWCRDRAIHLALMESVQLFDGKGEKSRDAIPSILSEALSVSFDNNIGHDYLENYQERYEYYHRKEEKVPFDLEYFDKISSGGISNKTLTVALAGTGVGKSLFMCNFASSVLLQGKNVLYITMEMAEEKIAERIDANLLDVAIQNIVDLPKSTFENKVTKLAAKTQGSLIIKEYPTASAHSGHFKSLLSDLELKKSFRPDIIFIDYLNICASSRYRGNSSVNSYSYIKSIAEELRGLAVEANVPIVSATQTTRSGYASSDIDLTDTSESFGLPATADLMFALISTDELQELGQIMVKQLKNRYNDPTVHKRFILGIDRAKMRLYDCEQSEQNIVDSGQNGEYNDEESENKFKGFQF
jgi:replicative DNA helicase